MSAEWKQIAWNGVRFEVPQEWEIGGIGLRYLLLENDSRPLFEIKWARIKGRFSHRAHLKRLMSAHSRTLRRSMEEIPLAQSWRQALGSLKAVGFSWQGPAVGGRGAVAFCPECRTAALLQFYQGGTADADSIARRVLSSYRDHGHGPSALWSVFDIRAEIPRHYDLKKFRFDSGAYELSFADRRQRLDLIRWAPAAALLRESELGTLALRWAGNGGSRLVESRASGVVELRMKPDANCLGRLWRRMQRKPRWRILRLWHEQRKNRILGVRVEGSRSFPAPTEAFNRICSQYVSL